MRKNIIFPYHAQLIHELVSQPKMCFQTLHDVQDCTLTPPLKIEKIRNEFYSKYIKSKLKYKVRDVNYLIIQALKDLFITYPQYIYLTMVIYAFLERLGVETLFIEYNYKCTLFR